MGVKIDCKKRFVDAEGLAEEIYARYGIACGGVNWQGEKLPEYEELGEDRKLGWAAVAEYFHKRDTLRLVCPCGMKKITCSVYGGCGGREMRTEREDLCLGPRDPEKCGCQWSEKDGKIEWEFAAGGRLISHEIKEVT